MLDFARIDEHSYCLNTSLEHRKKYAQFFTPQIVADLMTDWLVNNMPPTRKKKILEPAIGLGVFSRILRDKYDCDAEITAYEVDSHIIKTGHDIFAAYNIQVFESDYMTSDWENRYDGIICNPPYFKFHDYDNLSAIKNVNEKLGCKLTGFTNLYALFILKSLYQLKENGCAVYIVPSEFLNSDYGKEVKRQMLLSGMISDVLVFDFEEKVFGDALTTASILFFKKSSPKKITFHYLSTVEDLQFLKISSDINYSNSSTYNYQEILPEIKWRNYYQKIHKEDLQNTVSIKKYCKVMRGIATGANHYFAFNNSKRRLYNIPYKNLLPCVTKGSDINRFILNSNYLQELIAEDKNIFLIDCKVNQCQEIQDYIELGINEGVNEKFLTKNRSPWYSIEQKKPADLWLGVFNRDAIKVVLNKAKILNLTTFHGVYIHPIYSTFTHHIFAFFLTKIAKRLFDINRREYGNGLNKFEPNDFNNSLVFDFELMTVEECNYVREIVDEIEVNEAKHLPVSDLLQRLELFYEKKLLLKSAD